MNISLTGQWFLEGDSQPDDNWWADWYARAEVYDPGLALPELNVLGWSAEYHALAGPGHKYDYGSVNIAFSVELEYEKDYALRFWADLESHAEAVPEPTTLVLLTAGTTMLRKRRKARLR